MDTTNKTIQDFINHIIEKSRNKKSKNALFRNIGYKNIL